MKQIDELDLLSMDDPIDMDDGPPIPIIQPGKPPRPIITWKNRRRMAWVCLLSMIAFISALSLDWIPIDRIDTLEPIITTFLYVLGGVIVAYMGFTSIPFIGKGR